MNYPYPNNLNMNMPQPFMGSRPTYMDMLSQQTQFMGIKGRPVASFEEAKASMIDFDGSIFYFPDAANQKIYTKQINLDGTSSFKVYTLVPNQQIPQTQNPTPSVNLDSMVSREEFTNTVETLMNEIQQLKGAMTKDDESAKHDATIVQF